MSDCSPPSAHIFDQWVTRRTPGGALRGARRPEGPPFIESHLPRGREQRTQRRRRQQQHERGNSTATTIGARRFFLGATPPNPHILALRARYSTRCANQHLTESDYARSANDNFLGGFAIDTEDLAEHFTRRNRPTARPVYTPRRRVSTDDY